MNFLVVTLFTFFLVVQASPLFAPRASFDVWVPTITSPIESTVWRIGADETVTWYVLSPCQKVLSKPYDPRNTKDAPIQITNKHAAIYLDQDASTS